MTKQRTPKPGSDRPPRDEGTDVRSRELPGSGEFAVDPDSVVLRRGQRLEEKTRLAKTLLERMPAEDRRRRLLQAAIVRRDEVLLDGFIAELGG